MNIENIKNIFKGALNKHLSEKTKIYTTISLAWIIFIGYLTWWNGLGFALIDFMMSGFGSVMLNRTIYFTLFEKKN